MFIDTYHNMRKRGVQFRTQYDETRVPVLTPPPSDTGDSTSSSSAFATGLGALTPKELFHLSTNVVEMLQDMVDEAVKSQDSTIRDDGIIVVREGTRNMW